MANLVMTQPARKEQFASIESRTRQFVFQVIICFIELT